MYILWYEIVLFIVLYYSPIANIVISNVVAERLPLYPAGCLTLQGNEFSRKGKWKESGRFWHSVEFARNGKCKER